MKARVKLISMLAILSAFFLFSQCNDDDDDNGQPSQTQVQIEITDAAYDDPAIQGVYITISEIRINGELVGDFQTETINLTDFTNGETRVIANTTLAPQTYNSVTLTTSPSTDASGASPGNYVMANNTKYPLNGSQQITITNDFEVSGNNTTLIIDFDLRKLLTYAGDAEAGYAWADAGTFSKGLRVINESKTGTIDGVYEEDAASDADLVVVYAYPEGTFNTVGETNTAPGAIQFLNAAASGAVSTSLGGNTFIIPFLEEGEYTLHYAAFSLDESTGRYQLESLLRGNVTINGSQSETVNITAGQTADITVTTNGSL